MRWLRSSMREFKIKDFLINSTLIPVDGVLTNLVRSRWPNIEKIVCVQSLKSRRVFNYHSPQRTHRVTTEFLLRDQRGTGKTGLLCPLGEPIETIDLLQLAHVRTRSRLSNKGTYPHWRLWGGALLDDAEVGLILFGFDETLSHLR